MAGKNVQKIFCCRLQINQHNLADISKPISETEDSKEEYINTENLPEKKLNIFLASTAAGALRIGLSFDGTLDCVSYFRPIFPQNQTVENRDINQPLIRGVHAALHNQTLPFSIKYDFTLTAFTKSVLNTIQSIPFGTTRSYKEIGRIIGRPMSARAIGQALGKNPLPLIFP